MPYNPIDNGSFDNDPQAEKIREAFGKANGMFLELYQNQADFPLVAERFLSWPDTSDPELEQVAAAMNNAIPNIVIPNGTVQVISFISFFGSASYESPYYKRMYLFKKGSGTYGNGTFITVEPTDFIALAPITVGTDTVTTFTLGDIGATPVHTYVNNNGNYEITGPSVFTATISGVEKLYIFSGPLGLYGLGESQTTAENFIDISTQEYIPDPIDFLPPKEIATTPYEITTDDLNRLLVFTSNDQDVTIAGTLAELAAAAGIQSIRFRAYFTGTGTHTITDPDATEYEYGQNAKVDVEAFENDATGAYVLKVYGAGSVETVNGKPGPNVQLDAIDIPVDNTGRKILTGTDQEAVNSQSESALLKDRTSGWLKGGDATDLGAGVLRISSGEGQILDNTDPENNIYYDVSWIQTDIDLAAIGDDEYYIYVDSNGDVLQRISPFTHDDYRLLIPLFTVVIRSGVITAIASVTMPSQQFVGGIWDVFRAYGISKSESLTLGAASTDLSVRLYAGDIYSAGISTHNFPLNPHEDEVSGQDPVTFQMRLRDNTDFGDTTVLDPGFYDNAGVRTAISGASTRATLVACYIFPGSQNVRMFYGQEIYNTIQDAVDAAGMYAPVIPSNFSNAILLGYFAIEKGATNLADGVQKFIKTNRFGGIAGAIATSIGNYLQAADNLSDLDNVATARTNLDVYSTTETDTLAKYESFIVACSDETTALTVGTAKVTFRMPFSMTLSGVRASVGTAPTGANLIVDVKEGGVSIFSTLLSIDAGEKTSTTATTPVVISDSALADDAEITIDITQIGSTGAGAGLKVTFIGART